VAANANAAAPRSNSDREVDDTRLHVKDIVSGATDELGNVDLGPAPPPGASRLMGRNEIEASIQRAGQSAKGIKIPESIRVVRASRTVYPEELTSMVSPHIEKNLRPGISLKKMDPAREIVVSPRATVLRVTFPTPPRQKGTFRTTATVEIGESDEAVTRVFIPLTLDVTEEASRPDIARGSKIALVLNERGLEIQTGGLTMADANVGDVVQVRVTSTNRVLRARIQTRDKAEILN
jgi:hypothetical protein